MIIWSLRRRHTDLTMIRVTMIRVMLLFTTHWWMRECCHCLATYIRLSVSESVSGFVNGAIVYSPMKQYPTHMMSLSHIMPIMTMSMLILYVLCSMQTPQIHCMSRYTGTQYLNMQLLYTWTCTYNAPHIWNTLPNYITGNLNVTECTFERILKTFLH